MSLWDRIRFWKQRRPTSEEAKVEDVLPKRVADAMAELNQACKAARLAYLAVVQYADTSAATRSAVFGNRPSGLIIKLGLDLGIIDPADVQGPPKQGVASA